MKTSQRYWFATALGVALSTMAIAVDIPRLGAVYYGQLLNSYGYPCTSADGVRLMALNSNRTQIAYYDIGPTIGPGINYRLQINCVASGSGLEGMSVAEGGKIQIQATSAAQPSHIIGNTNITVNSGAVSNMAYVLGTDSNNDGIPDEWEQMVIDAMNSLGMTNAPTDLAHFNPNISYVGNGFTARQSFYSGCLPFIASDYLHIQQMNRETDGTCHITFLGNQGFKYQIHASSNLVTGSWQVTQFGTNNVIPAAQNIISGAGNMQDLYFPTNGLSEFIRLIVK